MLAGVSSAKVGISLVMRRDKPLSTFPGPHSTMASSAAEPIIFAVCTHITGLYNCLVKASRSYVKAHSLAI